MLKAIEAKLTRDRNGNALAVLQSEPFNGLEATPEQLGQLALALIRISNASFSHADQEKTGEKTITLRIENA
jgi:hypothetical protein